MTIDNTFQDSQNPQRCDNIHNENNLSSSFPNSHLIDPHIHRFENPYNNTHNDITSPPSSSALADITSITNIPNIHHTLSPNNIHVNNTMGANLYTTTLAPQNNFVSNVNVTNTISPNNVIDSYRTTANISIINTDVNSNAVLSNNDFNSHRIGKRAYSERDASQNDSQNDSIVEPASKKRKPSVPDVDNCIANTSNDKDTVFITFANSSDKRIKKFSRLTRDMISQLAREHNVPENDLFILYTRFFRHVPYTFADPIFGCTNNLIGCPSYVEMVNICWI
eukprot:107099_1